VETISAYLLCCGLADAGSTISAKNLAEIWNGTPAALAEALETLEKHNIINRIISGGRDRAVYRLNKGDRWKLP